MGYAFNFLWCCLYNPVTWPLQDTPDYAPGTQKNVSGEVIRWNNVSGLEKIDAKKYVEFLEAEIEELNRQLGRKAANGQNELLEYLKTLEPQNLKVRSVASLFIISIVFLAYVEQVDVFLLIGILPAGSCIFQYD